MKELRGRTVLVTGAASGIGREAALAFAREGSVLLLVDIDNSGLEDLAGEMGRLGAQCMTYRVDVSNPKQVFDMARRVESDFGGLDILVNNAGVFVWADFVDTTIEDMEWMMGVNLWGPIHTIKAFLPGMIERRRGHIVNVASAGGLVTLFSTTGYCATKFGLVGLGEALLQEVSEHNIAVTTICPGSTKTPIINHIRVRGLDGEKLEKRIWPVANRYSAKKTGGIIVEAVKRDRVLVVTTLNMKVMYLTKRISPALYRALAKPFRRVFNAVAR